MAYDKVIDSVQLESAMTATADAIREKTGDSAKIEWLTERGFADAVGAIEAGSGGGSFETCTVTIQGLGGDPDYEKIGGLFATTIENGECSYYAFSAANYPDRLDSVTINNVLCGSYITVLLDLYALNAPYIEIDGTMQVLETQALYNDVDYYTGWFVTLKAPIVAGENTTMHFSYDV